MKLIWDKHNALQARKEWEWKFCFENSTQVTLGKTSGNILKFEFLTTVKN